MAEPNYMAYAQFMGARNPMAEGLNQLSGTLSDIQKHGMEREDRTRRNSLADLQMKQAQLAIDESQRQATDRASLRSSLANLQPVSSTTITPGKTAPTLGIQAVPGGQYLNGSPTPRTGSLESEMAANGLTNNAEGFQYPQQQSSPIVQAYNEERVATKTTSPDPMKVLFDYAMKTGDYDSVKNALPLDTIIRKRAAEAATYGDLATADKLGLEAEKIEKMGGLIASFLKVDPTGKIVKQYVNTHPDLFPGIDPDGIGVSGGLIELKGDGYKLAVGPDGKSHMVKDATETKGFDTIDLGDKVKVIPRDGSKPYEEKKALTPAQQIKVTTGTPNTDFKNESSMRKEFLSLPEVKEFPVIEQNAKRAVAALKAQGKTNVAVDQTIITVFNKMLDPSSVVRESEYARTPQDLSVLSRIKGKWDKIQRGGAGLDSTEREALARMVTTFNEIASTQYNDQVEYYSGLATRYGYKPENIVRLGGRKAPTNAGSESPSPKQPALPKPGHIENGYKFKGGNPADQKNWMKVGR